MQRKRATINPADFGPIVDFTDTPNHKCARMITEFPGLWTHAVEGGECKCIQELGNAPISAHYSSRSIGAKCFFFCGHSILDEWYAYDSKADRRQRSQTRKKRPTTVPNEPKAKPDFGNQGWEHEILRCPAVIESREEEQPNRINDIA